MYITLETDYAVRITAELCKSAVKIDAAAIAERTGVTLRFALKILRKLVSKGIVRSYKGTHGGYMIDMPPEKITLKMVVEAIEGEYCFSRCLSPDGECNRGALGSCQFQDAFAQITQVVTEKLDSYDFAYLIEQEKAKNKSTAKL